MKKIMITLALIMMTTISQAQTLGECQQAAEKNYPLIKQYGLIAKTTQLTVKNIQKAWLPQLTASAQATYQSAVTAWPERMQTMYQQMGLNMKGLSKDQYKIGVDLQQTVYDGGSISNQRNIAQQEGKVQEAQTEANLYQVRQRVNEMYFSLLLLNEQIQLNEDVKTLLLSSENKLSAMVKGGTAATSDLDNVRAERLSVEQQNESLKQQKQMLQRMLSVFCGIEVNNIHKPEPIQVTSSASNRPEMRLYDSQLKLTEAKEKALDTQLRPKLGLFAQGYYGYPGLNMFEDMMNRKWSLNGIVGIKLSWNVSALYTHKNDKARLSAQREMIENAREVFLFNNKMEEIQQSENISRYQTMIKSDDEIIVLRTNVRKAAESKLAHGIIDINSLLREISNENAAKTQQTIHEIDMLKEMYHLKYTNNE
ncbi:TolC family protein [Prevotella scopos JCM 17725]|uniref:Outer membrane protein TolC n=1 Tax=Prevotella scopos JCM 17725 TaxID=1236518 RepID=A0AAX2F1W6_9BACT|nr:TolC family protein [Prevotella scopos]ANR73690.1 transporter [Prevotella scopos JCM 17725]QUB44275.1 TolC family protein [Prevotella scopos JCM 17725]SHF68923.1 Outer membrane protein TolC [Prevotella scopos JCM 17725]